MLKPCIVCGAPSNGPRCHQHGGNRRAMNTTQRGYGSRHRRRREALLQLALGQPCPLCGELMRAGQPLDLDHSTPLIDNPTSLGDRVTHARCNRRGARALKTLNANDPATPSLAKIAGGDFG